MLTDSPAWGTKRSRLPRALSRWSLIAVACLVALLLPVSGVGATKEPAAGTGDSASDTRAATATEPDDSAGGVEVVRYASSDPYELSTQVARALLDAGGGSSEWVVLTSGEHWTNAVAAGPLAASLDAPVVLVPPGGLQTSAARSDLVKFLRSAGVRRALIVGDPEVLPNHEPSVLFGLGMLPRNIERVHGDDPVGTSIAVAERMGAPAELADLGRTVIIASDQSVADTVAVGPLVAAGPFPLLLNAPDALDPRVAEYLTENEVAHVVLVGGTNAITPAVQEAIETTGTAVTRLAGEDRYHTAVLTMDLLAEVPRCADDAIDSIGLAPGEEPLLALTAGRFLGPQCIPLLFTDSDQLVPVTQNHLYLYRHRTGIEPSWHLIGPNVAIDPSAIQRPPVRMATVANNPDGGGQIIVVLDEQHQARRYLADAGLGGITQVRWASDRATITFSGIRGGSRSTYELDVRSGTVKPQSLLPAAYERLIQDEWVDPMPSPDREYIVFRAPTENHTGHSLFAFHVETETITQITRNTTNDTHHVANSDWLPDGRRLIYTHEDIEQRRSGCGNVPHRHAHVVDIASGQVRPLEHGAVLVDEPLVRSPDSRFLAIKSYEAFESAPEREDLWNYGYWNCTHDGVGTPSISVYDLSGPEPQAVTETGLSGHDPTWSPDSRYLALHAPSKTSAGHSLFALDTASGDVTQLTQNESRAHHHVAQVWLPFGHRLLYTVQDIAELETTCRGLSPSQWSPYGVPHHEVHIVNLENRRSLEIEFDGFVIRGFLDTRFHISPDGGHLAFASDATYEFHDIHGRCEFYSDGPFDLNLVDIGAQEPQKIPTEDAHSHYFWGWSPNGRYLAYTSYTVETTAGSADRLEEFVLDTESKTIWRIDTTGLFGTHQRLRDRRWSDDSRRLLYFTTLWTQPGLMESAVIANVATEQLLMLDLSTSDRSYLRSTAFSPDGYQVVLGDWGGERHTADGPSDNAGLLYVSDLAQNGALLGVYDMYAVTEPAIRDLPDQPMNRPAVWEFVFEVEWTVAGIFTAGEHYLFTSYRR